MRRIDGVSQKMLTKTLKDLEENGLVLRTDYHEVPPKVDYRLTELGQSLGVLIGKIDTWVVEHFYETQSR
jgi:DNA-binding HxlR family transcriptional regulator